MSDKNQSDRQDNSYFVEPSSRDWTHHPNEEIRLDHGDIQREHQQELPPPTPEPSDPIEARHDVSD